MEEELQLEEQEEQENQSSIDVVEQDLTDIIEERTTIPASMGVKVKLNKVECASNANNSYRWFKLTLKLTEGIQIGDEMKYKGSMVFCRNSICYYADPEYYTKDYFKKKQHLLALKKLSEATGVDLSKIDSTTPSKLVNEGSEFLCNIVVMSNSYKNKAGVDVTDMINDIDDWRRIRPVPVSEQV